VDFEQRVRQLFQLTEKPLEPGIINGRLKPIAGITNLFSCATRQLERLFSLFFI
jgi:hypothetical protein